MIFLMWITTKEEPINYDKNTIENIKILVERSLSFFEKYGPITKVGFTFEEKGYTNVVDAGDGDFFTDVICY